MLNALIALMGSAVSAAAQGGANPFRSLVQVESAYVRAAPSLDSPVVASVFEDDLLDVVGRNADGTWFQVRRPGRLLSLGWLWNEMLDWEFRPELLPLADGTTDLLGPAPLPADAAVAVFVVEAATMHSAPFFGGERITIVPHSVVVPVLGRNQDGSWLRVNYRGYEGWIIGFTTRPSTNILAAPEAPGLPPLQVAPVVIIPPEIQRAQVERFRAFLALRRDLAAGLVDFWWVVERGEVVPCNPPSLIAGYIICDQDIRELPELDRYVPRVNEGIAYLNASLEPLQACGLVTLRTATDARNDAINARIILDVALDQLAQLEENVIE